MKESPILSKKLKNIKNKKITKNNYTDINWDDDNQIYINCDFQDFECEGGNIGATFEECDFKNIFYYWTLFVSVEFIECSFNNCTFSGVPFADCKFIRCTFKNCKFIKDNLGRDCSFDNSEAINCLIDRPSLVNFKIVIQ